MENSNKLSFKTTNVSFKVVKLKSMGFPSVGWQIKRGRRADANYESTSANESKL